MTFDALFDTLSRESTVRLSCCRRTLRSKFNAKAPSVTCIPSAQTEVQRHVKQRFLSALKMHSSHADFTFENAKVIFVFFAFYFIGYTYFKHTHYGERKMCRFKRNKTEQKVKKECDATYHRRTTPKEA